MKRAFVFIVVVFLEGCVTPYKTIEPPKAWYEWPEGVQVTDLGGDIYNIYALVSSGFNRWRGRELALQYFERRREEIAKERGYSRCETLYVVGLIFYSINAGQADGRVKCFRDVVKGGPL